MECGIPGGIPGGIPAIIINMHLKNRRTFGFGLVTILMHVPRTMHGFSLNCVPSGVRAFFDLKGSDHSNAY